MSNFDNDRATQALRANSDQQLQSRWVVNLNSFKVKIEQDPAFLSYVLSRHKKQLKTIFLDPKQHVFLDHGYYKPTAEKGPFALRDCFSKDDLVNTLASIGARL